MKQDFPVKKLKLLKRNPRKISKQQFQNLCNSLQNDPDFLQKRPVLVNLIDGNYNVYAGNQRVRAAKKLGWKTIPCDIDENIDEKTMKKRILQDNLSFGEFDFDIISSDYEIPDLLDMGFSQEELSIDIDTINAAENLEDEDSEDEIKLNKCPECGCEFP